MAVLASRLLQPLAPVAHEVAKATCSIVQGRREKGEVTRGKAVEVFRRRMAAGVFQQIAEDKCPGVVIGAVTFMVVGHVENSVLEDARAVRHADDMIES